MIVTRIERRLARHIRGTARVTIDSARTVATIVPRLLEVAILKSLHRTDYRRWTKPDSLEVWWDSRTRLLAELVPAGSRVIEFGAGRRQLERYLDPHCTYVPSDLVDRGPGTIVCDLNRGPFPDLSTQRMDVAVFGGVLEYIVDLPALIEWLAESVTFCVASYACVVPGAGLAGRISDHLKRVRHGYMNHLTEVQIVDLFRARSFACRTRRTWDSQRLFLFTRESEAPSEMFRGTP